MHVVTRADGGALCFLGDVSGHDSRAAARAEELQARVRDLAAWMSPGALLSSLNTTLAATWPPDMFVSAVCLTLDAQRPRTTIAIAGQLPPIVRTPSSVRWIRMKAGPALGLQAEQRYAESTFVLGADDVLVAVTDGVTDPLATRRDFLGLAAMARIVHHSWPDSETLCTSLLVAAKRARAADDATILTVRGPGSGLVARPPMPRELLRVAG